MNPLTPAELAAAERKHAQRVRELESRGWGRPIPYTRHDVKTNFALDRWLMRQGIEPEETA